MINFILPEGFAENKTAIYVPPESYTDFIDEVVAQGYPIDAEYLMSWVSDRTKEGRKVYFHFREKESIQAFCAGSRYYTKLHIVNFQDLSVAHNCTALLDLL